MNINLNDLCVGYSLVQVISKQIIDVLIKEIGCTCCSLLTHGVRCVRTKFAHIACERSVAVQLLHIEIYVCISDVTEVSESGCLERLQRDDWWEALVRDHTCELFRGWHKRT